jgi:hypothetical protein
MRTLTTVSRRRSLGLLAASALAAQDATKPAPVDKPAAGKQPLILDALKVAVNEVIVPFRRRFG